MDRMKKRKLAAALAAIAQYEAEMAGAQAVPLETPTLPPAAFGPSPWTLSGRQDQMMYRAMWQRRLGR